MKKKLTPPQGQSSEPAAPATDTSPRPTSTGESAPPAEAQPTSQTADQRIAKLETDLERIATLTMQIVTYIDKQQNHPSGAAAAAPQPQSGDPQRGLPALQQGGMSAGLTSGMIEPILKLATSFLGGGGEQQRDPFELEIYKGMRESFVEGFKSYITTVNQNAQIGAQVLDAIKNGKLKLEAGAAAEAAE